MKFQVEIDMEEIVRRGTDAPMHSLNREIERRLIAAFTKLQDEEGFVNERIVAEAVGKCIENKIEELVVFCIERPRTRNLIADAVAAKLAPTVADNPKVARLVRKLTIKELKRAISV